MRPMRMPKAKVLLVIVGLMVLSGLGGWAFFRGTNRVEYRTAIVERGNIEATISATVNPNAVVTVQVGNITEPPVPPVRHNCVEIQRSRRSENLRGNRGRN